MDRLTRTANIIKAYYSYKKNSDAATFVKEVCGFFDFIKQFTDIGRYRTHAYAVQSPVEHMSLYAGFAKGFGPFANCLIGIFSKQQVDLFKSSAVGFNTCKAAHLYDVGCDFYQLINSGDIFSGRLPHIPEHQAEFDLSSLHKLPLFYGCNYILAFGGLRHGGGNNSFNNQSADSITSSITINGENKDAK